MPRGVYNRKKRKIKRIHHTATGTKLNLWEQFPEATRNRILQHCEKNNIHFIDFIKKAVYDKLPVHYDVNRQFIFPFGKYQGETAESVQQMDPGYIDWACRTITGFELAEDMKPEVKPTNPSDANYVSMAQINEMLRYGEELKINRFKCWARRKEPFGIPKYRLLAVRANECAPWIKV